MHTDFNKGAIKNGFLDTKRSFVIRSCTNRRFPCICNRNSVKAFEAVAKKLREHTDCQSKKISKGVTDPLFLLLNTCLSMYMIL